MATSFVVLLDDFDLLAVAPDVVQPVEEERPTKTIFLEKQVAMRAQVQHFDFAGRTDGRFIKHMISNMVPRHIIVVHGSSELTESFRQMVDNELPGNRQRVHCPDVSEMVDVSSGSNSFPVVVSDAVMKRMQLRHVKEYQLGWVEGQMGEVKQVSSLDDSLQGLLSEGNFFGGRGLLCKSLHREDELMWNERLVPCASHSGLFRCRSMFMRVAADAQECWSC